MKTVLKITGISLLATIIYIIVNAILPFSESFKAASRNSNTSVIIFLWIVNIWFTSTVFYIGKTAEWNKRWLLWSLIFVYLTVYSFMTQIETIFFENAFEILSKFDAWLIMLSNIIPLFVIVPLTLKIVNKKYPETNPKIEIKLSTILTKVGILAVVYVVIYFLFGYFVALQFSDVREFYSGTTEKQTFISLMIGNFQNSNVVTFQFLRGILFSTFILPIVFMFKGKNKQLLISLVLVYLSTAIVLIIPNFLFPETVRWAHFIEMMSSMTTFAVITWLVWKK